MTQFRQIALTPYQQCRLERWRETAFRRVFLLADRCLGARTSGDTLEAIASGCARLLVCRKAGRMAGLSAESARGLRPYNLRGFFHNT